MLKRLWDRFTGRVLPGLHFGPSGGGPLSLQNLKTLGKYRALEYVSSGVFGHRFRATDPLIARKVTLMVMDHTPRRADEPFVTYHRAIQLWSGLRHRNIVLIFDLGEDEGLHYVATEFLEDADLQMLIRERYELPLQEKLAIIGQVAEGLHFAQERGVLVRDLSAAHVCFGDHHVPKLVGFSLAWMPEKEDPMPSLSGAIGMMSPEQVRGEPVDARSAIWNLGVILYEWLAFVRPFSSDNMAKVMFDIVSRQPAPIRDYVSDAPEALQAIITRALQKNPAERYQTAAEMARDLLSVAGNLPLN